MNLSNKLYMYYVLFLIIIAIYFLKIYIIKLSIILLAEKYFSFKILNQKGFYLILCVFF